MHERSRHPVAGDPMTMRFQQARQARMKLDVYKDFGLEHDLEFCPLPLEKLYLQGYYAGGVSSPRYHLPADRKLYSASPDQKHFAASPSLSLFPGPSDPQHQERALGYPHGAYPLGNSTRVAQLQQLSGLLAPSALGLMGGNTGGVRSVSSPFTAGNSGPPGMYHQPHPPAADQPRYYSPQLAPTNLHQSAGGSSPPSSVPLATQALALVPSQVPLHPHQQQQQQQQRMRTELQTRLMMSSPLTRFTHNVR